MCMHVYNLIQDHQRVMSITATKSNVSGLDEGRQLVVVLPITRRPNAE